MSKKLMIVLGLAMILVLASVSMAYAAANSGYAAWSTGGGNLGTSATPHKDYRTTTVKCAVCHAVHKATAGGELLLRGSAGTSCEFCHIEDNIGLVRIYNGAAANYSGAASAFAHNMNGAGVTVGSRCSDCHATHGANTMSDLSVDKFILKSTAGYTLPAPGGQVNPQAAAIARAVAGDKDTQIDVFCSMCHPYVQPNYNGQIAIAAQHAGAVDQVGNFQSHVMRDAGANYGNLQATYGGKVAWFESNHCRSCHDAGETDTQTPRLPIDPAYVPGSGVAYVVTSSFPHYTPNYTRFLISKGFQTDAAGQTTYAPSNSNNSNTMTDGVCLKCHRNNAANTGVGFDF